MTEIDARTPPTKPISKLASALKGRSATSSPSSDTGLYVKRGEIARKAPLMAGQPAVVVELGSDNGPSGIGLLRLIEMDDDGKIVSVYLEAEDGLSRTLIQSDVGFRIIQGSYSEKEYSRYINNLRGYVAETNEESEARMGNGMDGDSRPSPEEVVRAIAAATGARIMGVEVMDEDEEIPQPPRPRNKTKH